MTKDQPFANLKSSTWRVFVPPGRYTDDVTAIFCLVNAGALVFKNADGNLIKAFAPGHWLTVDLLAGDRT